MFLSALVFEKLTRGVTKEVACNAEETDFVTLGTIVDVADAGGFDTFAEGRHTEVTVMIDRIAEVGSQEGSDAGIWGRSDQIPVRLYSGCCPPCASWALCSISCKGSASAAETPWRRGSSCRSVYGAA